MNVLGRLGRLLLASTVLAGSFIAPASVAATSGGSEILVPYASDGWRYATAPPDGVPGFEAVAFDDAAFFDGTALFGTSGDCASDGLINTPWTAGEDLLVRRAFSVPDDGRQLRIGLQLVRDAQVFLNGVQITDGFAQTDGNCPFRDVPLLVAPDDVVVRGGLNVLAIRARAPASSDPRFPATALFDAEIRLVERPANDDRADAVVADIVPYTDTVGLEGATLEPGENTSIECGDIQNSVWYAFTAPDTDSYTLDPSGDMDAFPIAARYADDGQGGLTMLGCVGFSRRPFRATAGTTQLIQVGTYRFSHSTVEPITVRIDRAPDIEAEFFFNPGIAEALAPVFFHEQSSDPANGRVASWAWDFGDGGTSTEQFPSHRYAAPGDYDVTLAVETEDGRSDSVTRTISIHPFTGGPVVADFIHGPSEPFAGQEAFFLDTSSDPAGMPIVDWQWSFDDGGTATGNNPSHVFATVGEHQVSLTVTTEDGRTASTTRSVTVLTPPDPIAGFGYVPQPPTTAIPVSFFDQSNDPIGRPVVAWSWSFGDGGTSTEASPSHRFGTAGDYTVELTVTTDDGRSATTSQVVSVAVPPDPIAGFGWHPFDPSIIDTVQFFAAGFDPAGAAFSSWSWAFGDGSTSSDPNPVHRFTANGTYDVTLLVTTEDGRTAQATNAVTVATHDVSIKAISAPKSASAGQTKTVNVDLANRREPESVQVDLYRTTSTGQVFVGSQTVAVPVGKSTRVSFDVTFDASDAIVGKVTFTAVVTIIGFRDAVPGDNTAISPVTKITR